MKNITQTVTIKIDNKSITAPAGTTVLEAAQQAGIYIPTLCYLKNVTPYGGCRLCIVNIKNVRGNPTACTTPITQDMIITTKTPELQLLRKEIFELALSEHPYTCLICKDKSNCTEFMNTTRKVSITTGCNFCTNNGDCELQELMDYLELKDIRYPIVYRGLEPVKDNPFYEIDYNLCVLCGRCVRVCNEERNSEVLAFVQRGNATLVGTAFNESQKDAGCEYCGACIDVCPTGSISEKIGRWAGIPDNSIETTCPMCSVGCTMNINTRKNRIVNVGPKPGRRTDPPQICVRGKFAPGDIVHHPDRITTPLIRKGEKWNEVSWDEAINFTVNNLERYRGNQFGIIGSAQDSLEDNYVLQKFARKVMRSNNVDMLSSFSEEVILKKIYNYYLDYPPIEIDDILNADTILIIGSQAHWSHPIVENRIRKAYKKGIKVIAANTHYSRTSFFSEQNVYYKPGEEYAFLLNLLAKLVKGNQKKAISKLKQSLNNFNFEMATNRCGIPLTELEQLAKSLLNSTKLVILAGDGILRSVDSTSNFNALYNIQMVLEKPDNCRIMFLLDEGNRYGGTFVGMHPGILPGFETFRNKKNITRWSKRWKAELSNIPGLSCDEMVNNIAYDGITAIYVVGDIPPHPNFANLKFFIHQNLFFTETSKYSHVFFPITSFTETDGHIINLEGKLKKITPVISPIEGVKIPWEIITKIAYSMLEHGFDYEKTEDIFSEIKSFINLSFPKGEKKVNRILPLKVKLAERKEKFPFKVILEQNYFNFMGNNLTSLISDMNIIREEGILNLSRELASKLNVKDGDSVSTTTEHGKAKHQIKIQPELNDGIVFFKPNWNHIPLFSKGLNINRNYIAAKIEKE